MNLSLQNDMDAIFLSSGFEETVTYTPVGEAPRDIPAIVTRRNVRQATGSTGQMQTAQRQYDIEIQISTSATNGVAIVTSKADKVVLPKRFGDTAQSFIVAAVIENDAGCWRLGLGS